MNRLKLLSFSLLLVLPVACLLAAIDLHSVGFFVFGLPGAVTPGLTAFLIYYYEKKSSTPVQAELTSVDW